MTSSRIYQQFPINPHNLLNSLILHHLLDHVSWDWEAQTLAKSLSEPVFHGCEINRCSGNQNKTEQLIDDVPLTIH